MAGDGFKCKILNSGICIIAECWYCTHIRLRINSAANNFSHLKLTKVIILPAFPARGRNKSGKTFHNLKSPHIFVNAGGFKRFVQAAHLKTIQKLCY